jgi:ABC-type glycerol-3-phosphate transport system permease component
MRELRQDWWRHALLLGLLFFTFYPFLFLLMTSLKDNDQFFHRFWSLPAPPRWENYRDAWDAIKHYILNSVVVSSASVVGVLAVASLAAYVFARHRFPGSTFLFYAILALLMFPGVLTLISAFVWMKDLRLLNTRWALILPYIAGGQVFAIFVLRSFIAALPEDLFEAARLDGASEFQIFARVAMPLCKSILGTLAIMNLIGTWNDYIWPLIVLSDDAKKTLSIGLSFFQGAYNTTYGPLMAGYVIASLPLLVLFLFTMRHFMRGLMSGAIKA